MASALRPTVAIVGGGPAGLGAALELRQRGVDRVMVFEREPEAGGIPRHCAHPTYGIREFGRLMTGPEYASRLRALAVERGVEIRVRHSVVALGAGGELRVAAPDGLRNVEASRVIVATGARETPRAARLLSGDRPTGILNTGALQGLIYLKHLRPFKNPVIVGTELVSLAALWTCRRHGIHPVAVIEEGDGPTAGWPLGLFPRALGVPVYFRSRIGVVTGLPRVTHVDVVDRAGSCKRIACDGVLLTGHFVPEAALLHASGLVIDEASGGPSIDQDGHCSASSYFAAGNILRPIETAGWCYREGRRIGAAVAADLVQPVARDDAIRFTPGAGVKFVVPQAISRCFDRAAFDCLQVRATFACRGRLTVRRDQQILWSTRISARPERRILIPLTGLSLPSRPATLSVSIETDS
jgi:NADPH-dependent 2,4-dienoyl-CoA reductase/sulfur reductase-like enzyme